MDLTNLIANFPFTLFLSIPPFTIPILTALVFHRNKPPLHSVVGILCYSITKGAWRIFFFFFFFFVSISYV